MIFLVSSFVSYLVAYKYTALFLIIAAGSFIIPIPLNEILVVAGAFASAGKINIIAVIAIGFLTNVAVDIFAYFLTYHYGDAIFRALRIKKDTAFFKVKKYLENYAYGTIYFCKIVGPFGPMVNFVAGLIRIPFKKFVLFDVLETFLTCSFSLLQDIVGDYWQKFLTDFGCLRSFRLLSFSDISYIKRSSEISNKFRSFSHWSPSQMPASPPTAVRMTEESEKTFLPKALAEIRR